MMLFQRLANHRTEIIAGLVTTVIVVAVLLFPQAVQGVEIDIDPPPETSRASESISFSAIINIPVNQFISALNLEIDSPDNAPSTVGIPLEPGPFDLTEELDGQGQLTGTLSIDSPDGFGYGYGYGDFEDTGYGYGYGYGYGSFSESVTIIVEITFIPPTSGTYVLKLISISEFDGEQAIAQDQAVVSVIDPRIDTEITASSTEVLPGQVVTLFISESNAGDVNLTNPFVELQPFGLILDRNSASFTGGDLDADGELDVLENWTWQLNVIVNSDVAFTANGHATDPLGDDTTDSSEVSIAVEGANEPPVLSRIVDRTVSEGDTLQINVIATDPNGNDTIRLTASGLADFMTFIDNGNGRGVLLIEPGFDDAGLYDGLAITATDDDGLGDTKTFIIIVANKNSPPDLSPIDDKVVSEGDTLTVELSATDPENDPLTLSASGLPRFASIEDQGKGQGLILAEPGFDDAGIYSDIQVTAADDSGLTDVERFSITVINQNRAPVLEDIQNIVANEGEALEVSVSASDPDSDAILLTALGMPDFIDFADNGDGTGTLLIEPGFEDASLYTGLRIVASDGDLTDVQSFVLTVVDVNRAPKLNPIGDQSVDENDVLQVQVSATDPDGDSVTLSASGLPDFATFEANDDGAAIFRAEPGFDDAGVYEDIEITAEDEDGLTDVESFTLLVRNVNRSPNLSSIQDRNVAEGDTLIVTVTATDPDGDDLELTATGLPDFVTFEDNGDNTGAITIAPELDDAGVYDGIEITAEDDGGLSDSETFVLSIRNFNRAPEVEALGNDRFREGQSRRVNVRAKDPDNDPIVMTVTGLPDFAEFVDEGDGKGTIIIEPGFTDAGIYSGIIITAEDNGGLTDSVTFTFIVLNRNGPPVIDPIGELEVEEGSTRLEPVTATDPDGDDFSLEFLHGGGDDGNDDDDDDSDGDVSDFVIFLDNGDGTGTLLIEPGFDDAGTYNNLEIRAEDEEDNKSVEEFTIIVIDRSRPPQLGPVSDKTVREGDVLIVDVKAFDPDGDELTLRATGLPDFVRFTDNGDGTARMFVGPHAGDEGAYENIEITVEDENGLIDTESFVITVQAD